ncbi:MAG: DUF885 family protein [Planctomycetes bacterium]|nr:DUF885 family protein [Planctomycetota bacterium]
MVLRPLVLLALAAACRVAPAQDPAPAPAIPDASAPIRERVVRFEADWGALGRFHDAPLSPARSARLGAFLAAERAELARVDPARLELEERLDLSLLVNRIDALAGRLELEDARRAEVLTLVPYASRVVALCEARQRVEPVEPRAAADELDAIARAAQQARTALEQAAEPPAGRALGFRAARTLERLRRELDEWRAFRAGYDPLFDWWTAEPAKAALAALEAHGKALRKRVAQLADDDRDTILGDPIGRAALLAELGFERIAHTPEELVDMARAELALCRAAFERAAVELGHGTDWRAALEAVKAQHVAPGEQPALVKDLAQEAVEFVTRHELVSVPPLAVETWRMRMLSPEAQKTSPFFLGGEVVQVSFPTGSMSHEDKLMSLRANNRAFSRAVVHHELIPGHHLQQFMTQRFAPHRRAFQTAFWTEGWALWWEMLLWDQGFARTPEERIGMLFWRSHRCARIVFSLSFHLGTMSEAECVDFLVQEVGHERRAAEAEVRRSFGGDYGPLYQAAYLTGGVQFRALHRELVASGRMGAREFHDAVLRGGNVPIEFVRARLTGAVPAPGAAPAWRFLDEPR